MQIFTKYWGDKKPFKSMLTRAKYVPYQECFSYQAPYTGESILIDLKTILSEFRPTKIFVSSPGDSNVDHRALYLFLQVALWDLEGQIKKPQVFPYLVHFANWPKPRGYHPNLVLQPPAKLSKVNINWFEYKLSSRPRENKKTAISCYRSQIEYNPAYLYTFVRKNELFAIYPQIIVRERQAELDWQEGMEAGTMGSSLTDTETENSFESLAYMVNNGNLYIKIRLNKLLSINMGVNVFVFGYDKDRPFGDMPKIRIRIGTRGDTLIYDRRWPIFADEVKVEYKGKDLLIQCPLSILGNPDYILSCVMASNKGLPLYETAWRILKLK
ncbi:MAG: hypothetical protein NC914_00710 [Candidatus Omnitrophica bacterium]|nr:hypothetical protein [Candidatus Omnitrophota bacterium]